MSRPSRLGRELASRLEQQILSGRWPAGSKIPAERNLAVQFEVSRQTVREALDEIERAGLVRRRHGSGTYVMPRRLEQALLGHFSIVESMRSAGMTVGTQVLDQSVTQALPAAALDLEIEPGSEVFEIERLRTVDSVPFMLERTWLPLLRVPDIAHADLENESLYETLRERFGIVLVRAVESIEPVLLRADEARYLEDSAGDPALMLLRTTYDEDNRPIESARAILRAEHSRTLVERHVHEPDRG